MFKKILPPLLVVLAFLLDTSILPVFCSHWLLPLFALLLIHVLGLIQGRTTATLYGVICGLLVDITVSTPLGLMTLFYGALGLAGGWFGRRLARRINMHFAPLISASICFAVFELGMALYTIVTSAMLDMILLQNALFRWALDVAVAEVLFLLCEWIFKPSWSRFAIR